MEIEKKINQMHQNTQEMAQKFTEINNLAKDNNVEVNDIKIMCRAKGSLYSFF